MYINITVTDELASALVHVAVMCPTLSDPVNGIVVASGNTVDSQAVYFCNSGFSSRPGDGLVRICLSTGEWSGSEPQCICK